MRFYDVTAGKSHFSGWPDRTSRQTSSTVWGLVIQDAWLYEGSIMKKSSLLEIWMQQMRKLLASWLR